MPDHSTSAMRAAEEIVKNDGGCAKCEGPNLCSISNTKEEIESCIIDKISAIIERHCGETERALRAAAKWAGRGGYNPTHDPRVDEKEAAERWIEFWKKEAKGCQ